MSYPNPTPPERPQPAPKPGMSTNKKVALFGCLPGALLVVFGFVGCMAVGGAVVNEASKTIEEDAADDKRAAKEDVELLSCKLVTEDFLGKDVKAKVKITNNGDKRANYLVTGEFLDQDGNKVEELLASVESLEPGKSSTQDFTGLITSDQLKGVKEGSCVLLEVDRSELLAAGN